VISRRKRGNAALQVARTNRLGSELAEQVQHDVVQVREALARRAFDTQHPEFGKATEKVKHLGSVHGFERNPVAEASRPEQSHVESLLVVVDSVDREVRQSQLQSFADQLVPRGADDGVGFGERFEL